LLEPALLARYNKVLEPQIFSVSHNVPKILKHLGLWEVKRKPRPKPNAQLFIPESYPTPSVDDYVIDPDYPVKAYF